MEEKKTCSKFLQSQGRKCKGKVHGNSKFCPLHGGEKKPAAPEERKQSNKRTANPVGSAGRRKKKKSETKDPLKNKTLTVEGMEEEEEVTKQKNL